MTNRKQKRNFLDVIPVHDKSCSCHFNDDNIIVIDMTHKGVYNKIAQKIFKKPETSHITLDELGTFIYKNIDGDKTVFEIGQLVKDNFGDKCEPLYERLTQYMKILRNNRFIDYKKQVQ